MSYDVMFFGVAAGADPDETLERLLEDEPPRDAQLEAELARVLGRADPSLEPVHDDDGAVVQLDGPEMQICFEPGHLFVAVPYWTSVDVAALLARLEAIAGALRDWRGWVAWDPQLGRVIELPRDASEIEDKFAVGVEMAQAAARGERAGTVYRPKRQPEPEPKPRRRWPPWRRAG